METGRLKKRGREKERERWKVSGGSINIKAISSCTLLLLLPRHIFLTLRGSLSFPLPHPVTLYCLVLFTRSCSLSPLLLFHAHTHELRSRFNHQLKMTAGTEGEEKKGIVRVCECVRQGWGVTEVMRQRERERETERERWGGGGVCHALQTQRRANGRRRQTERGTPPSNESWG